MTDYAVTLSVPQHIYEHARRVAEENGQAVEAVLLHQLEEAFADPFVKLPTDEQAELQAMTYLSTDVLWTIAREQMPSERQARMQVLMERNSDGSITEQEFRELEQLVEQGQKLMLRKAQASALLTRRGYKVTPDDMAAKDE
ncbi:MAG: hypothetical protein U0694_03840 [Anaerolineae bacterium]